MEEYLQNMHNLRSQINDFEFQATKICVEEEKLNVEIKTTEQDIESAKLTEKILKEKTDEMLKLKEHICCQIVQKQNKIPTLEIESSTLSKTLEFLQQEKVSLFAKIQDKRAYYAKTMNEMSSELQKQKDWLHSHKLNKKAEESNIGCAAKNSADLDLAKRDLERMLEFAKAKLEETTAKSHELALENSKIKKNIEQQMCTINNFLTEFKAMDLKGLEEEQRAVLSDKAVEMEYLQSLQERIEQIKAISEVVRCHCGQEYLVEMSL